MNKYIELYDFDTYVFILICIMIIIIGWEENMFEKRWKGRKR